MKNGNQLEIQRDLSLKYRNKFDLEEETKFKIKQEENSNIIPLNKSLFQIWKKVNLYWEINHKLKKEERKSIIKYRTDKKIQFKTEEKVLLGNLFKFSNIKLNPYITTIKSLVTNQIINTININSNISKTFKFFSSIFFI